MGHSEARLGSVLSKWQHLSRNVLVANVTLQIGEILQAGRLVRSPLQESRQEIIPEHEE